MGGFKSGLGLLFKTTVGITANLMSKSLKLFFKSAFKKWDGDHTFRKQKRGVCVCAQDHNGTS